MSEVVSGAVQIQFNAKDGTATAVDSLRSQLKGIHKDIEHVGHAAEKMSEQFEKGAEHAVHHLLRHAQLGGILLTGGLGGLLVTGGVELFSKLTEAYERKLEEARKRFEENMKLAEEGSKASFGLTRLTRQEKLEAEYHPEKAKIISELRKENPSLSHEEAEEQAEYLAKRSPGEPGMVDFVGAFAKRGDYKLSGQIGEASQGRYEELTQHLKNLPKTFSGEDLETNLLNFAKDLTQMGFKKADLRNRNHSTPEQIEAARKYIHDNPESEETPGHANARIDAEKKESDIAQAQEQTPNIVYEKRVRAAIEKQAPGFLQSEYGEKYNNNQHLSNNPAQYQQDIINDSRHYLLDKKNADTYIDRAMFAILPKAIADAIAEKLVPGLQSLESATNNINNANPTADSKP